MEESSETQNFDNIRIQIRPLYCYSCDTHFQNYEDFDNHHHPTENEENEQFQHDKGQPMDMTHELTTTEVTSQSNEKENLNTKKKKPPNKIGCPTTSKFKMKCLECSKIFNSLKTLHRHVKTEKKLKKPQEPSPVTPLQNNDLDLNLSTRPKRNIKPPKTYDDSLSNQEDEVEPKEPLPLDDPDFDPQEEKIDSLPPEEEEEIFQELPEKGTPKKYIQKPPPIVEITTKIQSPTKPRQHFQCSCGKKFTAKAPMKLHARQKGHDLPEESQLVCPICPDSLSFKKKRQLIEHMTSSHGTEKLHKCKMPNCTKSYWRPADLRRHVYHHHKIQEEYKCSQCHYSSYSYKQFQQHLTEHRTQDHPPQFPYSCLLCIPAPRETQEKESEGGVTESSGEFKFKTKPEIQAHYETTHPGQKLYPCSETGCDRSFWEKSSLQNHHLIFHVPPSNFPHKCESCDKTYKWKWQLNVHRRSHTGEQPFLCSICGMAFDDGKKCNAHMKGHQDKFQCTLCPKSFNFKANFQRHLRIHEGIKPHQCTFCPKSFVQKVELEQHLGVHTGIKKFNCQAFGCGKGFQSRVQLNFHTKNRHPPPGESLPPKKVVKRKSGSRKGVKWNKERTTSVLCNLCGKSLANNWGLALHLKVHDKYEGMEFICGICDKKFTSQRYLTRHGKMHDL